MSARLISKMTVRIKVARSELMSSTPTLAKIAVRAANTADRTAQNCQDDSVSGLMGGCASVAVVRQHRQRRYLDAFVDQSARFLRRSLAVDRTVLDIAV